jgi:hypothetical protein
MIQELYGITLENVLPKHIKEFTPKLLMEAM